MNLRFWTSGILVVLCSLSQGFAEQQHSNQATHPATEAWQLPQIQQGTQQKEGEITSEAEQASKEQPELEDFIDQSGEKAEDNADKQPVLSKQRTGTLSLSGSITPSFEFKNGEDSSNQKEKKIPYGCSIGAKFSLEHKTDQAWGTCSWGLTDKAGLKGSKNGLKLKTAFIGCQVMQDEEQTIEFGMGRKPMSALFSSSSQFGQTFDGMVLKFKQESEDAGKFYAQLGTFLSNRSIHDPEDKDNASSKRPWWRIWSLRQAEKQQALSLHYAGELGLENIAGTGLAAKYSLAHWNTPMYPQFAANGNCQEAIKKERQQMQYCNSQLTLSYALAPEDLGKKVQLSVEGLYNHLYKSLLSKENAAQRNGFATAASLSIGELKQQGDWSVQLQSQYLAPSAVPQSDAGMKPGFGLELRTDLMLHDAMQFGASWKNKRPRSMEKNDQNRSFNLLSTSVTYKF